ncbi:RNA-binding S4 domain-containing protein [Roseobacter sp. TSBP12]|uniref:RNA-binding S4 domain-containing protein n=1 Tax=Roseobacter sp. TSBP12 TaxID=1236613 RepID=UPI00186A7A79|nr:RNA-binding S4 domain-containing protein [Roseobacter sp. TSBP12]
MMEKRDSLRLDKWLWYARFFKTRSLAAKIVTGGHVRVNSNKVSKAATTVGAGDVLTFAQGNHIRVVKLVACGTRRGPAPEAQALYEDLSPPVPMCLAIRIMFRPHRNLREKASDKERSSHRPPFSP